MGAMVSYKDSTRPGQIIYSPDSGQSYIVNPPKNGW